ncbi:UNVERIFIED_CONTAM: hypothetical protein K2H54_047154 [Gekko kuhli]
MMGNARKGSRPSCGAAEHQQRLQATAENTGRDSGPGWGGHRELLWTWPPPRDAPGLEQPPGTATAARLKGAESRKQVLPTLRQIVYEGGAHYEGHGYAEEENQAHIPQIDDRIGVKAMPVWILEGEDGRS